MQQWIRWYSAVGLDDLASVGGKNASLGEMVRELTGLGVKVPMGFALTAQAYREFLRANSIDVLLTDILAGLDRNNLDDLRMRSEMIRELFLAKPLPDSITAEVLAAYRELSRRSEVEDIDVAVRSSATAEDLPNASFAGQQDTFLNIRGESALNEAIRECYASLYSARAIAYRADMGFDQLDVALSVGVQRMVRADLGASGVIFSLDPESGHRNVILVSSSYGLGEAVVQGQVVPDQFYVHKPTLRGGFRSIVWKTLGSKETKMIYDEGGARVCNTPVPVGDRARFSLTDDEVLTLARWTLKVEEHYSKKRGEPTPLDIEWAKDGITGELYLVQARPETVHSRRTAKMKLYHLEGTGELLTQGLAIGSAISTGRVQIVHDPSRAGDFEKGDILVTGSTDPDWEPIMKLASGIVTDRGGRTSHAAIVARELGIPAVLGTGNATQALPNLSTVTLSCAEGEIGKLYRGELKFRVEELDPSTMACPQTQLMLNVGSPEQAFSAAQLPNDGVGLARMEFIFANWVRVHPLALTRYATLPAELQHQIDEVTRGYADKPSYFVDKLSQGIGTIAAAFYPKPVILRLSDFKSNEYSRLLGGAPFEPTEENPMIGWRGASRYYHPEYKEGFLLEVEAIRRARETFGLTNLKLMVPFCRTPAEGRKVIDVLAEGGLVQGHEGLEIYVMAELPSNVLLADEYAEIFDGFSIGSNDLTQLILGVDRDSALVAPLFDERNRAVRNACAHIIKTAHERGRKVGICGQAPSDFPEFAAFLVQCGIDSISLNPDALIRTASRVHEVETKLTLLRQVRRSAVATHEGDELSTE